MGFSKIMSVALALEKEIIDLDFESLALHSSVKSYYRFDLTKIRYVTQCNAFILHHILNGLDKPIQEITIVDHGAGLGFFSFLVKKLGARCISHDLSEEYLDGIKTIGTKLNLAPDEYVLGGTEALATFVLQNNIHIDGIGSRNVIEHIPDYREFFKTLNSFLKSPCNVVITTSANMHHPMVKKIHEKIHAQYELVGSGMDMDDPTINEAQCGIKIRSALIQTHFPILSSDEVKRLAILNRGFTEALIVQRIENYIKTGILPTPHSDPTNTCDPYTGTWVERLVSIQDYKNAAVQHQFEFKHLSGFYSTSYSAWYKNMMGLFLNLLLIIPGPWRIHISPFLAMKLTKS